MAGQIEEDGAREVFPPAFTQLVAQVIDLAMKAIAEPDPTRYIEQAASALRLDQLRGELAPERRGDPVLVAALRCDAVRDRIARDLAIQIVDSYQRLRRAEETILQSAVEARRQTAYASGAPGTSTTH
ncbi:MAG: hypothetical protein WD341_05760 [Tistlia sp.]|uniref:hypothetical protein n=1 Tax=Tistlia sp. TaxID=3057121 RepID=UPI0034A1FBFF